MQVSQRPSPFTPGLGYVVKASGGTPPYAFAAGAVPPNPAGVIVTPGNGGSAEVDAPSGVPAGTLVYVVVTDSSVPPQVLIVANHTG
jgi:hypothetical protein